MSPMRWTAVFTLATCFACSSEPPEGNVLGPVSNSGGSGQGGEGSGAGGELILGGGAPGAGATQGDAGEPCRSIATGVEPMPVDLFFMFDQSSSMGELIPGTAESWWSAATQAVYAFVDNPRAAGIGMGIQYFPLNGVAPASCTAPYGTPEVPVDLLPGVGGAIKQSVAAHGPSTFTPSGPALRGAIDYMRGFARPGRAAAVVFVTDGFPTECDPGDTYGVAEIAAEGLAGTPSIRTFVVGFSQGLGNLREIARAGGTGDAFLIEGGDVSHQFVTAMLSISSTPLQCDFDIPPPPPDTNEELDINLVQMMYTPAATGVRGEIRKLNDRGECNLAGNQNQGWYYDHPTAPTKIHVCPGTCSSFAAGNVTINYGCKPLIGGIN